MAYPIDLRAIDEATFSLLIDHASHEALVESSNGEIQVLLRGRLYTARVEDERASRLSRSGGGLHAGSGEVTIKSPMPGLIVAIAVSEGQAVKKGQTIVVLESMKMENELKAPRDGTITSIKIVAAPERGAGSAAGGFDVRSGQDDILRRQIPSHPSLVEFTLLA